MPTNRKDQAMYYTHPIYGLGKFVRAAAGNFAYLKFDRETNCSSALGKKILAVSLKVCW